MPRKPRRPKPPMKGLRVKRGPHRDDPRCWYWRLRRMHEGRWIDVCFWARPEDVVARAMEEQERALLVPVDTRGHPTTVRELCRLWGREQAARPIAEDGDEHPPAGALRPRSLMAYKSTVKRITGCIGEVSLDRVSVVTLERYRDTSGWAARTVSNDLHLLSTIWRWGYERGFVDRAVLPRLTVLRRRDRPKAHTPTPGDVAATLAHLEGWDWLRLRMLAATGCRVGELATLTWDRVDLDGGWVRVSEKTGPRDIPITDPALLDGLRGYAIVRALVDPRPELLGVKPVTARGNLVGDRMYEAQRRAGVAKFTPHAVRRMVATQLHEQGMAPATIQSIMGHGIQVSLSTYYRPTREGLAEKAKAAGLGKLPAGKVVAFRSRGGTSDEG